MGLPIKPGESFSNDHFQETILSKEHKNAMGRSVIAISSILIIAPLLRHYVRTNAFVLSPQLVGMFMGMTVVIVTQNWPWFKVTSAFVSPYNVLVLYYTLMLVKFVYSMDSYVFLKLLSHILIISFVGWVTSVICFGFLLITFSGELTTLTFSKLCLVGLLFTPIEVPSVIFNIEQIKLTELVMTSESVFTSILSMTVLTFLLGVMQGLFVNWYQPVFVLIRIFFIPFALGIPCGLLAGRLMAKHSTSSVNTMLVIITSNFLMYHVAQIVLGCSGGLCCFLYMLLISRKRVDISQQVDKEILILIDALFNLLSTAIGFVVVCDALPLFLDSFTLMATAVSMALYICVNACRLVFFISISPLLSRLGYGFNFKTLVTMVWCMKKGPLPFLMLTIVVIEGFDELVPKRMLLLGLNYMFLTNAVNEMSAWTTLRKMGITGDDFLMTRTNMKNALKFLEVKRVDQLTVMKMNRFYIDANWKLINDNTLVSVRPTDDVTKGMHGDDGLKFENKLPYCTSCKKEVQYKLSKSEYQDLLNDVNLRILHAARVSFVRQFESGFVDTSALQVLNHLLDEAMKSKDYIIKFDALMLMLTEKHYNKYYEKLRTYLFNHDNAVLRARYIPRYPKYHKVMTHRAFRWFFDVLTLAYFIVVVVSYFHPKMYLAQLYLFMLFLFYLEFAVKLTGCRSINAKDGFRRYIKQNWNKFDFAMIILATIDIFLMIFISDFSIYLNESQLTSRLLYILTSVNHCLRMLRIFRLFRLLTQLQMVIVINYDRRVDAKLRHVYSVGRGVVVCYEEIDEILHTLTDEAKIVKDVRELLQNDRNRIARELGAIEMARPGVTMEMKTRQAMMCTMTTMRNAANILRTEGLIDPHEHANLLEVIVDKWKTIMSMKAIPSVSPRTVFYEIPWIGDEQQVFELLYDSVKLRVWDAGETIYTRGDVAEGVFIIVSGMFKVVYNPNEDTLRNLRDDGLLPVKDMLRHALFDFATEEYIFKGNSIGELSVMTGRPYCCDVFAEIPTQAFIIPKQLIAEALKLSPDPINGLFSRIWLHISYNFVKRLLREVPFYSGIALHHLYAMMARSFVAKMDAYDVFRRNDTIEDLVLIEGTVIDSITQECFIAPCVIPRGSPALKIPENLALTSMNFKPIIWVVPAQDMDPYEVMMFSEIISQLNQKASSDCFLVNNLGFRKWQKNRPARASMYSGLSYRSLSEAELSIHQILIVSANSAENSKSREFFSIDNITRQSDVASVVQDEDNTEKTSKNTRKRKRE